MHEGSARHLFDMLPDDRHAHAPDDEACYTVDLYADEHGPGETLVKDREVTRAVAQHLLEEPIETLRERAKATISLLLIQAGHADIPPAYL